MLRKLLLFGSMALFSLFAIGQHRCGAVEWDQYLTETVEGHAASREQADRLSALVAAHQKSGTPLLVPVVVHVIYRNSNQNISDEQIKSQIDVLNNDYNKMNWDTMKVPAPFKSLIADCGIEFKLANRDPNGNMTNGITRKSTTIKDIASTTGTRHYTPAQGGEAIWDRNAYLNIWVCEIRDSLYGFASFPGSPANSDGIVISPQCFGKNGIVEDPTDLGRTATHEIGHWFNLIHVWGDATCGDDEVADTPTQKDPNYDCPSFPHVSCGNAPAGDMFMNYMDYSDDNCMHMFTHGQKNRMWATINSTRISLFDSKGYNGIDNAHEILRDHLRLMPNPASHSIQIRHLKNGTYSGAVYTPGGQLIHQFDEVVSNEVLEIPVHHLPNGLYLLKLDSEDHSYSEHFQVLH